MSIARSLLEMIAQYAPANGRARVKVVRLRIGELAGVIPESLRFCFEVASEGTVAQGAELQIEHVPVMSRCTDCRCDFEVEQYAFICPNCDSPNVELISGNELDVIELEVEEEGCP
ncbi:MAG: hydrogenase maturation nickel metallochaperone HypA [Blastocatellia bacterium]|nr:hydrogenase maturation nickel metallochaperone HypA [Blastocatellia bacterium]